jgi:hypothetical protein
LSLIRSRAALERPRLSALLKRNIYFCLMNDERQWHVIPAGEVTWSRENKRKNLHFEPQTKQK